MNSAYDGTLSSYGYILLAIHFLQTRSPPILPCLQAVGADVERTYRGDHDVTYDRQVAKWVGISVTLGRSVCAFVRALGPAALPHTCD